MSQTGSPCRTEILYLLISNTLFSFPPSFWQLLFCSLLQWVWLFLIPHIRGFMQYLSSFFWLISLGIISSRLLHVVSYGRISFFLMWNNYPVIIYTAFIFLFISNEHWGCFHILNTEYCWSELENANISFRS